MADRKITDLTALTTQASGDVLPIVDVSEAAAADKNKKITISNLFQGIPVPVLVNQASVLSDVSSPQIETTGDIVINSSTTGSGQTASLNLYHLVSNNAATRPGGRISSVAEGTYTAGSASTSDSALTFSTTLNATLSERVRIDSSGRLLVGTTSARSTTGFGQPRLQLVGNYERSLLLTNNENNTNTCGIVISKIRNTSIVQNNDTLGYIIFAGYDGDQDRAGAYIFAQVDGTPGGNDMPGRLIFSTTADGASSPTERMRITSGGNIQCSNQTELNGLKGIQLTGQANAYIYGGSTALYVYGTSASSSGVYLTGNATSWSASSDERLKTDLENINDGLQKVGALRAVTGRYVSDREGTKRSFLIAQDVQAVLPEAVDVQEGEQGTLGLRYTEVIPLLVAALKESKERIETLEAKVAALESA